jgi:SPP1 gp7 family putative phage head morphogenesis protein
MRGVDSIINPAVEETVSEYQKWAQLLWHDKEPDLEAMQERMVQVLMASFMAGLSTAKDEDAVLSVDRHVDLVGPVFSEAVSALAKKNPVLRVLSPKGLSEQLRQTAWYVSGVMSGRILERIRKKLIQARVEGHGRDWFTQEVIKDAETTAAHIETVFRTNAASAAGAGRWKQYNDPDVADLFFGYRYLSQGDHRSRPLHKAMNGFVASKDDPIWKLIWVPNGYNCRCKIRPVRKADAIKFGLISKDGNPIQTRIYANDFQRTVVAAAEGGGAVEADGEMRTFPDEGFRGNAMMDLI